MDGLFAIIPLVLQLLFPRALIDVAKCESRNPGRFNQIRTTLMKFHWEKFHQKTQGEAAMVPLPSDDIRTSH